MMYNNIVDVQQHGLEIKQNPEVKEEQKMMMNKFDDRMSVMIS